MRAITAAPGIVNIGLRSSYPTRYRRSDYTMNPRYPRSSYRFGLDIYVQDFAEAYMPSNVLDLAKRAIPDAVHYLDSF